MKLKNGHNNSKFYKLIQHIQLSVKLQNKHTNSIFLKTLRIQFQLRSGNCTLFWVSSGSTLVLYAFHPLFASTSFTFVSLYLTIFAKFLFKADCLRIPSLRFCKNLPTLWMRISIVTSRKRSLAKLWWAKWTFHGNLHYPIRIPNRISGPEKRQMNYK